MKQKIFKLLHKCAQIKVIVPICIIVVLVILFFPSNSAIPMTVNLSEYSSVSAICEFATLKNFYHNVVLYEEEPDGLSKFANDVLAWPFGGYTRIGYKQYWLEYSGIVEAGIDANQIQIIGPDAQGKVKVFVPSATVLSVYADEASLTEPITSTGLFTTISGEEKIKAFSTAQAAMRQEAESDQAMLRKATENAKKLLERYIINSGKATDQDLSVVWLSTPIEALN